ncbi:hypothetical protein JHW43_009617 [Diplocarpon mali]|nr:hypothetical protein JHW43_009617 [Diplocarpon mali]
MGGVRTVSSLDVDGHGERVICRERRGTGPHRTAHGIFPLALQERETSGERERGGLLGSRGRLQCTRLPLAVSPRITMTTLSTATTSRRPCLRGLADCTGARRRSNCNGYASRTALRTRTTFASPPSAAREKEERRCLRLRGGSQLSGLIRGAGADFRSRMPPAPRPGGRARRLAIAPPRTSLDKEKSRERRREEEEEKKKKDASHARLPDSRDLGHPRRGRGRRPRRSSSASLGSWTLRAWILRLDLAGLPITTSLLPPPPSALPPSLVLLSSECSRPPASCISIIFGHLFAMGARWLVNAVLLALPVGTTLGVLLGVDLHRHSTGQAPLFNDDTGSGVGGGGGSISDNGVTTSQYCQKQVGASPGSKGVQYILNTNQWGWEEGTPGAMCMNVTAFNNGTYATNTSAPDFTVTWQYPPGPETQPVHAFPNVQVAGSVLPKSLQNLQSINFELQWTYGLGNEPAATTDVAGLAASSVNTNVAIDMFLDRDAAQSTNSSLADYEVMVWLATFGEAAQPIGLQTGIVSTKVINGTTFNLYTGKNGIGQNVLTWEAAEMTENFVGDIAPLLLELNSIPAANFSTDGLTLGHLGVGSEAFSAARNITWAVEAGGMTRSPGRAWRGSASRGAWLGLATAREVESLAGLLGGQHADPAAYGQASRTDRAAVLFFGSVMGILSRLGIALWDKSPPRAAEIAAQMSWEKQATTLVAFFYIFFFWGVNLHASSKALQAQRLYQACEYTAQMRQAKRSRDMTHSSISAGPPPQERSESAKRRCKAKVMLGRGPRCPRTHASPKSRFQARSSPSPADGLPASERGGGGWWVRGEDGGWRAEGGGQRAVGA